MPEPARAHRKQHRCFHRSHTHLLAALTPLVIGELVKDPDKRWRWIRIGSIITALVGEIEMSWRERVKREREEETDRGSDARRAFTLLELSIVLVIIGLLIGGIFVGQSLIHTAQLNAVISEFNRYQTAVQNFKQQYMALPGDMTNATSFWGSAGGTGADATCMNTVSTTAATCNGNGDGLIDMSVATWDESARFWQHLANAKMIEGSYTGVFGATHVTGVNVPASKYGNNTAWFVQYASILTPGGAAIFATDYGTGDVFSTAPDSAYTLTPKDAWSIDKKIDDGKPGLGNVILQNWPVCSNAASTNDLTAIYKLTTATASCGLIFLASF